MTRKWIVALVSLFIISLIGGVIAVSAAQTSNKDDITELQTEATQLGITTEDKDARELKKEIHEQKVLAKAKVLGITTEGKEMRDLDREVADASILNAAKDLGITTDNKTTKELDQTIKEQFPEEFAELDLKGPRGRGGSGGPGGHNNKCGNNASDQEAPAAE